jgi:MoaA/NifB/PqqE/SkfB family radical SAM enzyme
MSLVTNNIIKVEPTNLTFAVTWFLGLRCNFDCMYCPEKFHNLTDANLTLLELQTRWKIIFAKTQKRGLKYKLSFTGGEVTVNKNFLTFLRWLDTTYKDYISEIGFTTNGSAPQQYYLDAMSIESISFISFSIHSEFFNERKFFKTIVAVNQQSKLLNKSIHVNVMNEYWNVDRINVYCNFLKTHGINHSLNDIDYSFKIRDTIKINSSKQEFDFNEG